MDKKGGWQFLDKKRDRQFQEEVGPQGIMLGRLPEERKRKELEREVSARVETEHSEAGRASTGGADFSVRVTASQADRQLAKAL